MRAMYYDLSQRKQRRLSVLHIVDVLGKVYEAEYNYMESLRIARPNSIEYSYARYNYDTLMDVILMLNGMYE